MLQIKNIILTTIFSL